MLMSPQAYSYYDSARSKSKQDDCARQLPPVKRIPVSALNNPETRYKERNKDVVGGRTNGLWLFDSLLYPVLTNQAVLSISVAATYATTYGSKDNFMRKRGDWSRKQLQRLFKMSPIAAKETVMVIFSFLDGCVMAPVIKKVEDHRLQIAQRFDRWLGTIPRDKHVYENEPQQNWSTILAGRIAAFLFVLPTSKLLSQKYNGSHTFNQLLFADPGKKAGEHLITKFPALIKRFSRVNIPGLAEVCAMEFFYTLLCTIALYLSSHYLAPKWFDKKNAQ